MRVTDDLLSAFAGHSFSLYFANFNPSLFISPLLLYFFPDEGARTTKIMLPLWAWFFISKAVLSIIFYFRYLFKRTHGELCHGQTEQTSARGWQGKRVSQEGERGFRGPSPEDNFRRVRMFILRATKKKEMLRTNLREGDLEPPRLKVPKIEPISRKHSQVPRTNAH